MKGLRIIECEQGTPEWHKARAGIATASRFQDIVGRLKSKPNEYTKARQDYMYQLAGEIITEEIDATYGGGHLARGKALEPEAREVYEIMSGEVCTPVGFVINDVWRAGASPDSFIGEDGGLEVKTKLAALHIEVLRDYKGSTEVPKDHVAQVYGTMGLTGRKWWDFISYWPRMKPYIARVYRDETIIANLKFEVAKFNAELDALVQELRS